MNKLSILAISALIFSACSNDKNANAMGRQMPPLPVNTHKAVMGDIPITLKYDGQTTSELDVVLRPQVSGAIEEQFFTPGQPVKQGDKLYEIDKSRYQAVFDSANAAYKNATNNYNRAVKLKATNAISQKEFDTAKASYESTKAGMINAKVDLDHATITAPFDGVVGDTRQDKGSFVTAGVSELVRLSKISPIYVKFGISDVDKLQIDNKLNNGEWAQLNSKITMNINGKEYEGKVVYIDNVINSSTASVEAKAVFDNPNLELRPGTYAKVKVSGFYQKNGFEIPQSALLQDFSNSIVYVIDQNSSVAKRKVKVVSENAKSVILSEGIKNGDLVILDNFKKIRIGSKVQAIQGAK